MDAADKTPIECVGVICFRGEDVLLIRRGTPPRQGEWSIPGGRIEPGESEEVAALRELFEETGVSARLGPKIEAVTACFDGKDYILHDYAAEWISGTPVAGDDAADAVFMPPDKLGALGMWEKTRTIIENARREDLCANPNLLTGC